MTQNNPVREADVARIAESLPSVIAQMAPSSLQNLSEAEVEKFMLWLEAQGK